MLWDGVGMSGFSKMRDPFVLNTWVGSVGELIKNVNAFRGSTETNCFLHCSRGRDGSPEHLMEGRDGGKLPASLVVSD